MEIILPTFISHILNKLEVNAPDYVMRALYRELIRDGYIQINTVKIDYEKGKIKKVDEPIGEMYCTIEKCMTTIPSAGCP